MTNGWDETRIRQYIDDEIEESITLDYKASPALRKTPGKKKEISKDVSAMANSAGGIIIYGVSEYQDPDRQHLPERIDPVDRTEFSKEWLEHVINSNIHPRVEGLFIHPVALSSGLQDAAYVVEIPQSVIPHQAKDYRYYRRYNFESVPMLDYEVNDIRNRRSAVQTLVTFEVTLKHSFLVYLTVRNVGTVEARNVSFRFHPEPVWRIEKPPLFDRGAKMVAPGREISFVYHSYGDVVNKDDIPTEFEVEVSYDHPEVGRRIADVFNIDFLDYRLSSTLQSEVQEHAETLKKSLDTLSKHLKSLNDNLSGIPALTAATGLDLSVTSLQNLRHIAQGDDHLKLIDPYYCKASVFQEVLNVDLQMAHQLRSHFWRSPEDEPDQELEDLPGMTDEIIARFHHFFEL